MKWVTRRKARVDRIAGPWLIRRFIDPRREGALPFDVPGVELGHHGDHGSFDALYAYCRAARA
jgi:hypothetical protein